MQDLINKVNNFPLILKLLLCIPAIEIFYGVCRVLNQLTKPKIDAISLVLAVLTIVPGAVFMWVIDLIWVLLYNRAFLLN